MQTDSITTLQTAAAAVASGSAVTVSSGSAVTCSTASGVRGGTDEQGNVIAHVISDEEQLTRFLILGSEDGTYYSAAPESRARNVECVTRLITSGQGERVVEKVVEVVSKGRCVRINTALLVLAVCCRSEDSRTKSAAYRAILEVCNIPTHLFMFIEHVKSRRSPDKTAGWGRGLRKAVARWYNKFAGNPQRLAMLVTKYKQREGWSHGDVLRLGHVKPSNDTIGFILRYVAKGLKDAKAYYMEDGSVDAHRPQLLQLVRYLEAVEEVKQLKAPKPPEDKDNEEMKAEPMDNSAVNRVVALVQQFGLVREHLPTTMLKFVPVWQSLLEKMPMMALMRNLNKMTKTGVLDIPDSLNSVLEKLGNKEALRQSKVHPFTILNAWFNYNLGRGSLGKLKWKPVAKVCEALEQAFYAAFGNVEATNKRILIALDVSASMDWGRCAGGNISPRMASAAMCLVTLHAESCVDVMAFSHCLVPIQLGKTSTLEQAVAQVSNMHAGGTDCSIPMLWAKDNKKEYDAFIIYTDSETWRSAMAPAEALRRYRSDSGIHNARLAVVAMEKCEFSLADPQDLYMMDFVGFDTESPTVLQQFIAGTLYD